MAQEQLLAEVSKETLADSVRSCLVQESELVDAKAVNAAANKALFGWTQEYAVSGGVVSAFFYIHLDVAVKDVTPRRKFEGNAGGFFTPGAGTLFGKLYTDDINALCNRTSRFQFNATPVYFNVNFYDGNWNLLGQISAGAISIVSGVGAGKGSWSS